jgi:hypothetical protein
MEPRHLGLAPTELQLAIPHLPDPKVHRRSPMARPDLCCHTGQHVWRVLKTGHLGERRFHA